MKRSLRAGSALAATAATALVLSACGEAPDEETDSTDDGDSAAVESVDFKACLVSDEGGWNDRSFNESAYDGMMMAAEELGIEHAEVESNAESEYAPNVDAMVQQDCDLIFGVGFMLADAINDAAEANPDVHFALIDEWTDEELDNARPLVFNTAEAAYLGGYLAAGMSETGTVGTWGGIQIPSVTVFMDGFADGVERYNEDNGEDVSLVGWDKDSQNGSFSGDFSDQAAGAALTEQLLAQDADIIMPVAGASGVSAGPAIEAEGGKLIWVDSDGYESTDYGDVVLTSVLKQISQAVFDTVEAGIDGEFSSEPYVGDLENEGVGLAEFHDFADEVPEELSAEIDQLREEILSGDTVVESENAP